MIIEHVSSTSNYLDYLSRMDSPVHRLDPRAKAADRPGFHRAVVSFGKYEISALLPFFFFPVVMIALAGLPGRLSLRKILLLLPFALLIGIFNPLFDRAVAAAPRPGFRYPAAGFPLPRSCSASR